MSKSDAASRPIFPGGPAVARDSARNNRAAIFFCEDDNARYLQWLTEGAADHGCAVHAYVLVSNHVHLLVTPASADSRPRTMQSRGRHYVRYFNAAYRRAGTLWEGRYRATAIDKRRIFLACCRYIELNPVRAGMVAHPREYRWSSWHAHALGRADPLVKDHPLYRTLGRTGAERQKEYRALFRSALDPVFLEALRDATNGGWALGDTRFRSHIAKAWAAARRRCREAARPNDPRTCPSFLYSDPNY